MYVCARFTFFPSGLSIVICIANYMYSKVDSIAKASRGFQNPPLPTKMAERGSLLPVYSPKEML